MGFETRFKDLTGHKPMRWQRRLYDEHFAGPKGLPAALDLPTGLGKTSVMAIWFIARESGVRLPRRLVYVVDRRAVVDQATEVAEEIKKGSGDGAVCVSTLRGQYVDNRDWLANPAAHAIIVGTVDMIGSRLLFTGYGVSRRMRPYHAGLLGADALVVLDESHLVPPFERLLEEIAAQGDLGPNDAADRERIPRFHLLPLSATGRDRGGNVFRLQAEDEEDPIVRQRLSAKKRLTFEKAGDGKLEDRLAEAAWALTDNGTLPVRLLVYCNSREVAEKTRAKIGGTANKAKIEIELFVGARRIKERFDAAGKLKALGFLAGSDGQREKPAVVIATAAGEVGVDLDADHMVCDLVSWERIVQRLGRVNRLGGDGREAQVVVIDKVDDKLPEMLQRCAGHCGALLETLPLEEDGSRDVSPGALRELKLRAAIDPPLRQALTAATTPMPLYPALTRPIVDAWAMTSLAEHTGRPEVQPWLRGWIEDDAPQTAVVWRTYLPVRGDGGPATVKEMREFFAAARPHLAETLETETYRVSEWLLARAERLAPPRKDKDENAAEALDLPALSRDSTACIVLDHAGEPKAYSLQHLLSFKNDKKLLTRTLTGTTLVVDARLGGLTNGLLDDKAEGAPVPAADGEDGWRDGDADPQVPFRVRRVTLREEKDVADGHPAANEWQAIYAFDAERSAEGEPLVQFVVEKWHGEAPDEDARSISTRSQSLAEHQDWTRQKAEALAGALGLDTELGKAIVLAARLHDEGKRAACWQAAFHTPDNDGRPYAKSGSKKAPDFDILAGYRHEFGSLFRLNKDNEFGALPDDLKDLVRHLVVAHHGRARPVIETAGCDDGPPMLLAARARDVALRFARLQKRFGPWGLAWLEALVRAADQQASRKLDKAGRSDG